MQEKVLISNLPISYLSIYCTFKDFSYVEHAYISRVGTVVSWNQVPLKRDTPTEMNKTSRRYLELVRVIDFFGSFVHFVKYSGSEVKVRDYNLSKETMWNVKTEWFFACEIDRTPGVLPIWKRYPDEPGGWHLSLVKSLHWTF